MLSFISKYALKAIIKSFIVYSLETYRKILFAYVVKAVKNNYCQIEITCF